MRLRKKKQSNSIQVDLTPMIDIVFLLIVFYITVTQITKVDAAKIEYSKVEHSKDQTDTRVVISVHANGDYEVEKQKIGLSGVLEYLERQIKKHGDPGLLRVRLQIDRDSPSRFTNELVREIKALKILAVQFVVESQ